MLSTAKKVGPVLDLFTVDRPEWQLGDIARALGHARVQRPCPGEVVPDVRCCAVAVRDARQSIVAAMSISMPTYRFPADPSALLGKLRRTAERASTSLDTASRRNDELTSISPRLAAV